MEKEQPYPQAELITLALHVDYWNYLGWKDEFSSPLFSQRQEFYVQALKLDSSYTPQMVVDGARQFTGSDLGSAAKAVTEAAKLPKAKIELSASGDKISVKISDAPEHQDATVYLAVVEDNLTRKIGRGENSGKTLDHQSVARELRTAGALAASQNSLQTEMSVQINAEWKRENLKIVVFVQENASRRVLGAGRIKL